MATAEQVWERVSAWFEDHIVGERRLLPLEIAAIVIVGAILPLIAYTAPTVVFTDTPYDGFIPLDTAWRVASGQTPHIDFHTPVGPLYSYAFGAAFTWLGGDARVLVRLPAVLAPLFAAIGWWVTRERLSGLHRALFATIPALLVLSPGALDAHTLNHLALYNRAGWGLAVAAGLGVALVPRSRTAATDAVDAIVLGGLLAALFFLKVTIFGFGLGAVVLAGILLPVQRRVAIGALATAAALTVLYFAVSPVPSAYLADVLDAVRSSDPKYSDGDAAELLPGPTKLVLQILANATVLLSALTGAWLTLRMRTGSSNEADAGRSALLVAGLLVGALAVGQQSHDRAVPAVVVGIAASIHAAPRLGVRGLALLAIGAAALLAPLPALVADAGAVLGHAGASRAEDGLWPITDDPSSPAAPVRYGGQPRSQHVALQAVLEGRTDVAVYHELVPKIPQADLALMLIEADHQLRAVAPRDARVLMLAFSQPWAFIERWPAPEQQLSWYHQGRTFGGGHPLDPAALDHVDVIVESRIPGDPAAIAMREYLGERIARDYEPHETPLWIVWTKK